jgi:hypothetical protein
VRDEIVALQLASASLVVLDISPTARSQNDVDFSPRDTLVIPRANPGRIRLTLSL